MTAPSVKGYMPLSVTLRSKVCDEQGVGQWPMWKRYDSVKGIVDQYIDEPYREFLALPYYDIDKQKAEEYFYWYTPRSNTTYCRLSMTGDDHEYYKRLLNETINHYKAAIDNLNKEGKFEEANFLKLSLKYAGDSEHNVYCGDGRVVATVWGMRPRSGLDMGDSILIKDLFPDKEIHTVKYDLGEHGITSDQTTLKKSHDSKIYEYQVPHVVANDGYVFTGWNREPIGAAVTADLLFVAQYDKQTTDKTNDIGGNITDKPPVGTDEHVSGKPEDKKIMHNVRFLTPDRKVISEFEVEHGARLIAGMIPPLPLFDGNVCNAWDTNPIGESINTNRDFIAVPTQNKCGGCMSALLNWLLLLLGILLILLLLWCFISGKCLFNICGCDCEDTVYVIPPKKDKRGNNSDNNPVPPTPILKPCNELQTSGSNTPESFIFDMGHDRGSFLFEYATGGVYPDVIVIYDGNSNNGKEIFRYYGTTGANGWGDHLTKRIDFHKREIYIDIIPDRSDGTYWEINVNCP